MGGRGDITQRARRGVEGHLPAAAVAHEHAHPLELRREGELVQDLKLAQPRRTRARTRARAHARRGGRCSDGGRAARRSCAAAPVAARRRRRRRVGVAAVALALAARLVRIGVGTRRDSGRLHIGPGRCGGRGRPLLLLNSCRGVVGVGIKVARQPKHDRVARAGVEGEAALRRKLHERELVGRCALEGRRRFARHASRATSGATATGTAVAVAAVGVVHMGILDGRNVVAQRDAEHGLKDDRLHLCHEAAAPARLRHGGGGAAAPPLRRRRRRSADGRGRHSIARAAAASSMVVAVAVSMVAAGRARRVEAAAPRRRVPILLAAATTVAAANPAAADHATAVATAVVATTAVATAVAVETVGGRACAHLRDGRADVGQRRGREARDTDVELAKDHLVAREGARLVGEEVLDASELLGERRRAHLVGPRMREGGWLPWTTEGMAVAMDAM